MKDSLPHHRKTWECSRLLGVSRTQTVGHLIELWLFVQRHAWKDGSLAPWGEAGIARAAGWEGDPVKFCEALRTAGFLDGTTIHDWDDDAGAKRAKRGRGSQAAAAEGDPTDYEAIREAWNAFAASRGLNRVYTMTRRRRDAVRGWTVADLRKILAAAEGQPFLFGAGASGWRMDFDWLAFHEEGRARVLEGYYARSDQPAAAGEQGEPYEEAFREQVAAAEQEPFRP